MAPFARDTMSSTIDSNNNHRIFSKPVFFISFSALLATFTLSIIWLNSNSASHVRADLKHLLSDESICINPLSANTKVDAIYVLGGSQRSLGLKYKTASELFHKGICKRIWILSRPGKTEYSKSLKRNLTNDEWSLLKLKELGVPAEDVEAIKIKEGFFGTFAEAKGISSLIKNRGYKSLLLVSSHEHTKRIKISFDNFLKNQSTSIYIEGSGEKVLLRHLIVEFVKLKIYQYFLVQ